MIININGFLLKKVLDASERSLLFSLIIFIWDTFQIKKKQPWTPVDKYCQITIVVVPKERWSIKNFSANAVKTSNKL